MSQGPAINPLTTMVIAVSSDALNEANKVMLNARLASNRLQVQQFVTQSMMAGAFIPMEVPSFLGG